MRITDPRPFMDAMAESQDEVQVELIDALPGPNGHAKVLYVYVNGVSVLRIGGIIKPIVGMETIAFIELAEGVKGV